MVHQTNLNIGIFFQNVLNSGRLFDPPFFQRKRRLAIDLARRRCPSTIQRRSANGTSYAIQIGHQVPYEHRILQCFRDEQFNLRNGGNLLRKRLCNLVRGDLAIQHHVFNIGALTDDAVLVIVSFCSSVGTGEAEGLGAAGVVIVVAEGVTRVRIRSCTLVAGGDGSATVFVVGSRRREHD